MIPRTPASVVTLALVAWGCSEAPATNPFDPATPAAQQASGRITGRLTVPAGFDPALLAEARAEIWLGAGEQPLESQTPGEDGAFAFGPLTAGLYRVGATAPGLEASAIVIEVRIGAEVALGPVPLRSSIPRDALTSAIEGVAVRAGAADGGHAGILVQVVNTPWVTPTTDEGAFRLAVPPGVYSLRATTPGYAAASAPDLRVAEGETNALEAPLVLVADPGRIAGTVALDPRFDGPARLPLAEVALRAPNAAPGAPPEQIAGPNSTGAFLLDGVAPGAWRVDVSLAGFADATVAVTVAPGAGVEIGRIVLAPRLDATGTVTGLARLAGVGDGGHGGIAVRATGTPFSGWTDPEGGFALTLPEGRYDLEFARAGYGTDRVEEVIVALGEEIRLADPRVLVGLPATVSGTVDLPEGFDAPDRFERIAVTLRAPGAEPEAAAFTAEPGPDGRFVLAQVPPSVWRLRVTAPGFTILDFPLTVPPGEALDLGPLLLSRPASAAGRATMVEGFALRQGAPEDGHGDILVDAIDTPFAVRTTPEGRFRIEVTPEPVRLRFAAPGFGVQTLELPAPAEGETVTLPDPVVLAARPAALRGVVALDRFATEARLRGVDASLSREGAVSVRVPVDGAGEYRFDAVIPGVYTLALTRPGYAPHRSEVALLPGADLRAPDALLRHASGTDAAVVLGGRALAEDEADASRTQVQVRFADDGALFDTVETGGDGTFEVRVAPDERYTVSASRAGHEAVGPVGPVAWHEDRDRFEDEFGDPIEIDLPRAPFDGAVDVSIRVDPAWLPPEERYADVLLAPAVGEPRTVRVRAGATTRIADLGPGRHLLQLLRPGFAPVSRFVSLEADAEQVSVELALSLVDLSTAQLDLEGLRLGPEDLAPLLARGVSFARAPLSGVVLEGDFSRLGLDLSGANLSNADLAFADLSGVVLTGVDFFGARLRGARFVGANLSGARFVSTDLSDAVFVAEDEPRPEVPCDPDAARPAVRLGGAVFLQSVLRGVTLSGVDLSGVDLGGANLGSARLDHTCLASADLVLANLSNADLRLADLQGALLINAILRRVDARGANFERANLSNAILELADFACDFEAPPPTSCEGREPTPDGRASAYMLAEGLNSSVSICRETMPDTPGFSVARFAVRARAGAPLTVTLTAIRTSTVVALQRARLVDAEDQPLGRWVFERSLDGGRFHAAYVDQVEEERTVYLEVLRIGEGDLVADVTVSQALIDGVPQLDLHGACERPTRFSRANLSGASLVGARFDGADLEAASLVDVTTGQSLDLQTRPPDACAAGCPWAQLQAEWAAVGGRVAVAPVDSCLAVLRDRSAQRVGGDFPDPLGACTARGTSFVAARLDDADLRGVGLNDVDLRHARVRGALMEGVAIRGGSVNGADFAGARLDSAQISPRYIWGGRFANASLNGATLAGVTFSSMDLAGARLVGADLAGAHLSGVDLHGADLSNVDLSRGSVSGDARCATFENATLTGATLYGDLRAANLMFVTANGDAPLSLAGTLGCLDTCADPSPWKCTSLAQAHLPGAVFQSVTGAGSEFRYADLTGARFPQSSLTHSHFDNSILRFADLADTRMDASDFENADLSGAVVTRSQWRNVGLRNARLDGAHLSEVDLTGSDLWRVSLEGAVLNDIVLRGGALTWTSAPAALSADLHGSVVDGPCCVGVDVDLLDFDGTIRGAGPLDCSDGCTVGGETRTVPALSLSQVEVDGLSVIELGRRGELPAVDLRGARLGALLGLSLSATNLRGADLRGAELVADLSDADLRDADLRGAFLPFGRDFTALLGGALFAGVDLMGRNLEGVDLTGVDLSGALYNARTSWPEGVDPRARGAFELGIGQYIPGSPDEVVPGDADLAGLDFHANRFLGDFVAQDVDLRGANLSEVALAGQAQFVRADLRDADFSGADLRRAHFYDCDLTGADLSGAVLLQVISEGNDWTGVTLTDDTVCFDGRSAAEWPRCGL